MDEMNGTQGENFFSVSGQWLRFNGKRRGGGPGGVDAMWRRSGRERGRGALARRGAAWWRGISAAAGRLRCARAGNGGVDATRIDVADRWAGTLRGPGHQRLGAAQGSVVRRSLRR
jgi:hypothetical protein